MQHSAAFRSPLQTAVRFSLLEKARNKFALILLLVFVPAWDLMLGAFIPFGDVAFRLQSTGGFLQVDGHYLTIFTAGLNALTLVVAFMIFSATQSSSAFDKRLIGAGLPRVVAMSAKTIAIIAVSLLLAIYAAVILLAVWHSAVFVPVWIAYALDAMIYGAIGLLLGVLVTNQLTGFFLIIMVSLFETLLQVPIENPWANKYFLEYFPSFGPTQVGVSGGFGYGIPLNSVWLALGWAAIITILALAVFWFKTRNLSRNLKGSNGPRVR